MPVESPIQNAVRILPIQLGRNMLLDTTYPALFVVGVFGTIGCLLLTGMGLVAGRIDAIFIPLNHFDATTIIWFDFWMVLLISLVGQLLQGVALRTLNVALVVALTSYGSIVAGLAASIVLLGEHLTVGEIVAGLFLLTALGLSLVPVCRAGNYGLSTQSRGRYRPGRADLQDLWL